MMKTYRRPMAGWWTRNPFYLWYMLRELSSLFITAYALVLLVGLYHLTQGAASFAAWQAALARPTWLLFHAVALVLVVYHSWTWFKVMPKTMPRLPIPDRAIVIGGLAAVLVVSALVLWTLVG